ncbi:hypothetical protein KDX23_09945 [Burkholderia vietnamiensis]|uniref:hypothetical protein n=1 Tax=Burkholderia vietnamiensis TaxID=60552 RepID=UPI001B9814C3|nr:hypothetical protein [Burkholderia vietnamiensis]MBR8083065.1 hypothetical protein [Burkholderia vietnamiensis]
MKKILIGAMLALTAVAHAATKVPVQMLDTTSSTSGQVIVSPGPSGAAAWGNVSAGALAPIAANTVLGNSLGATAAPTAIPMPSCSGTNNALRWSAGFGFTCASGVALTTSALNQFAATTSAQLAAVISDETGSGSLVFNTTPTLAGTVTVTGSAGTALQVTTSGSSHAMQITDTGVGGATLTLVGNGATTPSKTIRATSGIFQILNDAYSQALVTLTDAGNLTTLGSIAPSATGGIVGTSTNNNANAGSVGEFINPAATSGTNLANNTPTNCASTSFTAGDWDVQGIVAFIPAGSTSIVNPSIGISTTSATFGGFDTTSTKIGTNGAGLGDVMPTPIVRLSLSATTTVYLVATAGVSTSTATCSGRIRGRRIR